MEGATFCELKLMAGTGVKSVTQPGRYRQQASKDETEHSEYCGMVAHREINLETKIDVVGEDKIELLFSSEERRCSGLVSGFNLLVNGTVHV